MFRKLFYGFMGLPSLGTKTISVAHSNEINHKARQMYKLSRYEADARQTLHITSVLIFVRRNFKVASQALS